MLDLGMVRPGRTIRIPLDTFAGATGASVTMTGFAASDVEVYKDGSTTQRASDAGYTATTDFDSLTGLHLLIIDLADNTTAGFWAAGSEYLVAVADVTIDSQTVRTWVARFRIGYADAIINTTIATLSSQTSFTLTEGPAEDDALNGCVVAIHDVASAVQVGFGYVLDYTGSTKTVTLSAGVTFTAAATDNVSIFPPVQVSGIAGQSASAAGAVTFPGTLASTTNITAGTITTATNLTNLPAITAGWLTATGIAADAFTAAKFHADVTTEFQAGLATASALTTVAGYLDTEVAAILADTTTLLSRLSAARAGYLDNLSAGAVALASGVIVTTNNDKTGYSLTQSFPSNFASMAITAAGLVSINTAQTLSAARALDAIADTSLTLNDALHCAIAAAAGEETVVATTYTIKTPSTNTVLRTFTLDSATEPTSRT